MGESQININLQSHKQPKCPPLHYYQCLHVINACVMIGKIYCPPEGISVNLLPIVTYYWKNKCHVELYKPYPILLFYSPLQHSFSANTSSLQGAKHQYYFLLSYCLARNNIISNNHCDRQTNNYGLHTRYVNYKVIFILSNK